MDKFSEMPPAFASVKDRLLREFPKERIKGINTQRVEDYIRQKGLVVKPYIVFDREDLPKVRDIEGNTNLLRSAFNSHHTKGLYSQEMNLVLITRERDYEESNGAIYTEGLLVHELAHASSMYQGYVTVDHKSFSTPRAGFCLTDNKIPWGFLLEEGWADMHRGNYVAQHASDEEKAKLKDAVGRTIEDINVYRSLDMEFTIPFPATAKATVNKFLPIPIKYVVVSPEGKPQIYPSAIAGFTLDLLCIRNPSIYPLLIEARSSVEGLRKLAQALDRIVPGLYPDLQKGSYSEENFTKKLADVISVVGGIENAVTAKGLLRNTWDEILGAQK